MRCVNPSACISSRIVFWGLSKGGSVPGHPRKIPAFVVDGWGVAICKNTRVIKDFNGTVHSILRLYTAYAELCQASVGP